jgi:hypothetical protein
MVTLRGVEIMTWNYEEFRRMTAEHFDLDEELIGFDECLEDLRIDPEDMIEFLLSKKDEIEEKSGCSLMDKSHLYGGGIDKNISLGQLYPLLITF